MDQSDTLSEASNAGDPLLPVVMELADKMNREISQARQHMRRLDMHPAVTSQLTTNFTVNIEARQAKLNAITRMDSESVRQAFEDEIIANEEATQRHHRDASRMHSLETRLSIAETALFKQNNVIDKLETLLTECLTTWGAKESARIELCRELKTKEKKLEQKVTQLTAKRDALQAENDDLQERLAKTEAALTTASGEVTRFKVDREHYESQIEHLTNSNKQKDKAITDLRSDVDELTKSEKDLRRQLNATEQSLHEANVHINELEQRIQQERQDAQLREQNKDQLYTSRMEEHRRALETRYKDESRKKVEEVTKKCQAALDRAKEETDRLAGERDEYVRKYVELQDTLEKHKRHFEQQTFQYVRKNLGGFLANLHPRVSPSTGGGARAALASIQEPERYAERFLAELRDASSSSDESVFRH